MKYPFLTAIAALGFLSVTLPAQDDPPAKQSEEDAKAEAELARREAEDLETSKKLLPAADAGPEKVIEALYKTPVSVFLTSDYPGIAARYLTKNLKAVLDDDYKRAAEEVPTITYDVRFVGDEEATLNDLKKMTIKATTTGDKSTVKASFQLSGAKQVMTYLCEKEDGQWKIADVKQEDGSTLLKLLAEAKKSAEEAAKEAENEKKAGK